MGQRVDLPTKPFLFLAEQVGPDAVGESWTYYFALAVGLEVCLLALILRYAWTWPSSTPPATVDRSTTGAVGTQRA